MFVLQNVEEELDVATESFLEGENCIVDMDKREVNHFVCCAIRRYMFICSPQCVVTHNTASCVFSADCLMR